MFVYILRRLLSTIPTIFGVALITFLLLNVVGGDPTNMMVGKHATVKQMQEVRHEYGFDQPLPIQFGMFLKQVVTFDYGRSFANKRQISDLIGAGVVPSLSLAIPAFSIMTILAVGFGLLVSYYRGKWIDKVVVVLCVVGMSISILAYILFGQYFFASKLGWFPILGYEDDLGSAFFLHRSAGDYLGDGGTGLRRSFLSDRDLRRSGPGLCSHRSRKRFKGAKGLF